MQINILSFILIVFTVIVLDRRFTILLSRCEKPDESLGFSVRPFVENERVVSDSGRLLTVSLREIDATIDF